MFHGFHETALHQVGVAVEVPGIEHRRARHAGFAEQAHDFVFLALEGPRRDFGVEFAGVQRALFARLEAFVHHHVGAVDGQAQLVPMPIGNHDHVRKIVGSVSGTGIETRGRAAHQIAQARAGLLAPIRPERNAGAHEISHGLLHGELDVLAFARPQPLDVRGQDRHAGLHARSRVAGGGSGEQWAAAEFAGDRKRAGRRLGDHVVGFVVRVGARTPKTLELHVDQRRVNGFEGFVFQVETLDDARPIVFDEDVVVRHHAKQDSAAFGFAQIQGQAALVGVPVAEIGRVIAPHRQGAPGFAAARGLDLDHIGAHPGHGLGARRAGFVLGHVEDSNSVECGHGGLLGETIP